MSNENRLISENLEEISQAKIMARLAGRSYLDPDDPERKKKRPAGFGKKNPVFVSVENAQAWVYFGTGKIVVACRGTEPTEFDTVDVIEKIQFKERQQAEEESLVSDFFNI